jgi:hypothetical protein
MRLIDKEKKMFMRNIDFIKYINSKPIDVDKLSKCSIEKMDGDYYIVLSKENIPKSTCALPLDVDIASQPDIVLIVRVNEDGTLNIQGTDKTQRIKA